MEKLLLLNDVFSQNFEIKNWFDLFYITFLIAFLVCCEKILAKSSSYYI